jgi:hypothetical protein
MTTQPCSASAPHNLEMTLAKLAGAFRECRPGGNRRNRGCGEQDDDRHLIRSTKWCLTACSRCCAAQHQAPAAGRTTMMRQPCDRVTLPINHGQVSTTQVTTSCVCAATSCQHTMTFMMLEDAAP